MCNLYNATTTFEAMRQLFLPIKDLTNRLTPQMDVYPEYPAPIGRKDANGDRELAIARWGMPTPLQFLKGEVDYGVTNIRNVKSPHWRGWLGPGKPLRCSSGQFFRVWPFFGSCDEEETTILVCPQRGKAAVLVRWTLDQLVQRARKRRGLSRLTYLVS
jgi:hypothetical protein